MKTPPYFPVYPKDQLTNGKLLSLSPAAFRAYHLLLYQSWTEEVTASLPDDDALLACYARMSCPEWLEVKTEVFALFTRRKDSRWYIDWLRTEFERMRNFQKSRQRAAEKRWEGKKNDKKTASCKPQKEEVLNARALHKECTSNADAMHVECFSSSHANTPTEDKSSSVIAASPPEPVPEPKKRKDTRPEAQRIHVEVTGYTKLKKPQIQLMESRVTDFVRWRWVVTKAVLRGWFEGNVEAMVEVYEFGFDRELKDLEGNPVGHLPEVLEPESAQPGTALAIVPRGGNGHQQQIPVSFQVQNELLRQHKERQSKAEIAEHLQRMNENQEKYAIKKRW